MKGKYTIVIYNNAFRYEITINKNITILKGESATGKSTLYNLFVQLKKRGSKSGIHCNMTDKIDILDFSNGCGYLLKYDPDFINQYINRYSLGNFTENEKSTNSDIQISYMIEFSKNKL